MLLTCNIELFDADDGVLLAIDVTVIDASVVPVSVLNHQFCVVDAVLGPFW